MFAKAYEIASGYTLPLIAVYRNFDSTVESGLGTFVVINDEGWIMTAAHNLQIAFTQQQHQAEMNEFNLGTAKINADKSLKDHQRAKALRNLKTNPKWMTHFMICLGATQVDIKEFLIDGEHDIAFLRVDRSALADVKSFPTFKDPANIKVGTSLCKLGHPFYPIHVTFDAAINQFIFPPNLFPIPRFPIEGIYTRNAITGKSKDGRDIMFIETSSPGLLGQSGGPIFDTDGNIYAVQSQNVTIPLGYKGKVEINGRTYEENQFINVGLGVHIATIVSLLRKHGIKFAMAE